MSKSTSLQCILLVQEPSQRQLFQNAVSILSYANEEFSSIISAVPSPHFHEMLLMKMQIESYAAAMCTFGAGAKMVSGK